MTQAMDRQVTHNRVVAGIFAIGGLVGLFVTGQVAFLLAGVVLGGAFLVPDLVKGQSDGRE